MADLTIPYGRDAAGYMVSARHVPRGAACGCVCPECARPLVAHQGETDRAWHFQHFPDATGAAYVCRFAYETSIHQMAKAIVLKHAHIMMPALMANARGRSRTAVASGRHDYRPIGLEVWLSDIGRRPDVMVETASGPLAIEIYVAHRVEPAKRAAFQARGLTAFEIDLSGFARSIADDEAGLAAAVLSVARREWLFHTDKVAVDAIFDAELIELERQAAEREVARLAAIAKAEAIRAAELAALRIERERQRAEHAEQLAAEREQAARDTLARLAAERAEAQRRQAATDALVAAQRQETERRLAIEALARADANGTSQRCMVCNAPYSPFGFGLPPRIPLWACRAHQAAVDAEAVRTGLVVRQ